MLFECGSLWDMLSYELKLQTGLKSIEVRRQINKQFTHTHRCVDLAKRVAWCRKKRHFSIFKMNNFHSPSGQLELSVALEMLGKYGFTASATMLYHDRNLPDCDQKHSHWGECHMFQNRCLRCTAWVATEWVTYSTILREDPSLATVLIFRTLHLQVYTLSICFTFDWALLRSYVPLPLSSCPKPFKMHKSERQSVIDLKK